MISVWLKSREHQVLLAILALAALLIFFRLDRADLQTDGAHYSLRALWYTDTLNTLWQSTPIQWFTTLPWWSRLSFHDAPPLAFVVQHAFFRLLGASTLVARLPGALAGLASVFLVYLIGTRLWGVVAGRFAALFLASSTLFVWATREPYLESQEIAWILLSVYAFLRGLKDPRWWYLWGAALGAALLTKYTAAFLLPAFGLYLLLYRRATFRQPQFWLGAGLALLLLTPVITYNAALYATRGHLDLQLSRLVPSTWPKAKEAWPKLYEGVGTPVDRVGYAFSIVSYLRVLMTWPLALAFALGTGWLTWSAWRRRRKASGGHLVWLALAGSAAVLVLTAPAPRYLPIMVPWLALAAGGALASVGFVSGSRFPPPLKLRRTGEATGMTRLRAGEWMPRTSPSPALMGRALLGVAVLILGLEILYNVNTNHALRPLGGSWAYASTIRLGNDGYQQLAQRLQPLFEAQPGYLPARGPARSRQDFSLNFTQAKGHDVFIYEAKLRWFSTFWYLQQQLLMHGVYTFHEQDLRDLAARDGLGDVNWFRLFGKIGVRRVYYIVGTRPEVFEPGGLPAQDSAAVRLEMIFKDALGQGAPGGVQTVADPTGAVAFRLYSITLNP